MVRNRRWLASGACLVSLVACSPTSPNAPDVGEVNIPGLPGQIGPSTQPTPYPTQLPKPGTTVYPTPWPSETAYPWPSATPTPYSSRTPVPATSGSPATGATAAFLKSLKQRGIQLSDDQLDVIRSCITTPPNGEWGSKSELSPEETLSADFARYGARFERPLLDEIPYKNAAVTFASGTVGNYYLDTQFYKQYELPLVAKWDSASRQFVLITADGALTTYTTVSVLQSSRYLAIPRDL